MPELPPVPRLSPVPQLSPEPRASHIVRQWWRDLLRIAGLATARCTVCGAVCEAAESGRYHTAGHPPFQDVSSETATLPPPPVDYSCQPAPMCSSCAGALRPRSGGYCTRCGMIFADETLPTAPCAACLITPPPWDSLYFVAPYTNLMRRSILRFKFHGALELGTLLGSMLATRCLEKRGLIDAVIPIPLHGRRLHERGYNQTLEIARPVATALNAPLAPTLLIRSIATPHQTGLSKKQRSENLRSAFAAPQPGLLNAKRILLVDDIMTTGATIAAAVMALRKAGAAEVHVAVVARTPDSAGK